MKHAEIVEFVTKLLDELDQVKGIRGQIPLLHIYLEYLLQQLIKIKLGRKAKRGLFHERDNYLTNAKILYAGNVLRDDEFGDIIIINNLRNRLSHKLKLKPNDFKEEVNKLRICKGPKWNTLDEHEKMVTASRLLIERLIAKIMR